MVVCFLYDQQCSHKLPYCLDLVCDYVNSKPSNFYFSYWITTFKSHLEVKMYLTNDT